MVSTTNLDDMQLSETPEDTDYTGLKGTSKIKISKNFVSEFYDIVDIIRSCNLSKLLAFKRD